MLKSNKALIYSWLNIIISMGGFLFLVPIALTTFSDKDFSFWLFTSSLIAAGTIIQSSLSDSMLRVFSKYRQHNKFEKVFSTVVNLSYITSLFPPIIVILICFVSFDNFNAYDNIAYCLLAIIFTIILNLISSPFIALLHTDGKIDFCSKIEFSINLCKIVCAIIVIYVFKTVLSVLISHMLFSIVRFVLFWLTAFSAGLIARFIELDKDTMKYIEKPIRKTFIIKIGGFFAVNSMAMVAMGLPPAEAASFMFTTRVCVLIYQITLVPFRVKLPTFVNYRFNNKKIEIRTLFIKTTRISASVYFIISLLIIFCSDFIFNLVQIENKLLSTELLSIILLMFFLEMHHVAHAMVYETTNNIPFVKISIISGITIYVIAKSLSPTYGIIGIIGSQFVIQFIGNNWFPVYLNLKSLNWPLILYIQDLFKIKHLKIHD
tara:strand:+ start:10439 stop:11737 length:1299 start_codon:yes stop_codon:yes gene_type:complete